MEHYNLLIGGELVNSGNGATRESIDPGSREVVATYAYANEKDAHQAIDAASAAFESGIWRDMAPVERSRIMMDLSDRLRMAARDIGKIEAKDSGGVFRRTQGDVLAGARMIRNLAYTAQNEFPWIEEITNAGSPGFPSRHYVRREPMGVCVGIVPWNFPFTMAIWKVAMAAIMGNSVILKPASETPLSALMLARIVAESNIPKGVINIIAGSGGALGNTLCTHPKVEKIAFTGSTEVGTQIMAMASRTIKKVTLELGGKSANIVLDDADIDSAVDGAILGSFLHSGQVCESGTRLLVPDSIYERFIEKLRQRTEEIKIGYQLDPSAKMGPLVSEKQLKTVAEYVRIGREEGATLITGGHRVNVAGYPDGFYYAPTIFGDVDNTMRIAQEEIFGPVLSVIRYQSEEDAIAIANESIYGLAGGVWSKNIVRAERVAAQIRTGTLWINDYHIFSDLAPFGGYKQSGTGRELGKWGLEEYTEVKHIHIGSEGVPVTRSGNRMLLPYPRTTFFAWNSPTKLIVGPGRTSAAAEEVIRLGARRVLLIGDQGIAQAGLLDTVKNALGSLLKAVYTDVPSDSSIATVDAAADIGREAQVDAIVSVGGGSVIDTAKAVAICIGAGGKAVDHIGIRIMRDDPLPHIVIPTTAGTGSEVTNGAVIKHTDLGQKVYILHDKLIPQTAILDPLMTTGLPAGLTAATGMDALCHGIESVVSKLGNPISEGVALQAIRLIAKHLPICVDDPEDTEARVHMQISAAMAGSAFSIANTGLVHGMAHALGAVCHVHHGVANGIILPHVMRFNAAVSSDKLALVAIALGCRNSDESQLVFDGADAVSKLLDRINHPKKLSEVGVKTTDLERCVELALIDDATTTNPRRANSKQIRELFEKAL